MNTDSVESALRQRYHGEDKPHRTESVLRYLLLEKVYTQSQAAEVLSEIFDYSVSKSMIQRAKDHFEIRDPVTDGPFADVLEGTDDGEQGQPPTFFLRRSDDNPIHPFDTECFDESSIFGEGGIPERNAESSTTAYFTPRSQSDSPSTSTDNSNSDFQGGTGVLKGHIEPTTEIESNQWRVRRDNREQSLVAPPIETLKADTDVPEKYHACGCGNCPERHFLDGDNGSVDCPLPLPVTIAGARRIYQKAEGKRVSDGQIKNDVRLGKQQYARLMKADSAALRKGSDSTTDGTYGVARLNYDDVTTVLLSLRLSPTDNQNRLVTLFKLIQDAKDAWAESRSELPTGDDLHAYFWTLAGTDEWSTPHIHCYLWYSDPDDTITEHHFKPTVQSFVKAAKFPADAHLTDNGDLVEGVVRVEHEPLMADPGRLHTRLDDGAFSDVLNETTGPKRLTDGDDAQTRGAIYVGSQLPKLALAGGETKADTEFAASLDVCSDGRQTARGGGDFYLLANALEHLSEYETNVA